MRFLSSMGFSSALLASSAAMHEAVLPNVIDLPASSGKRSVGDRAWRAYRKTKLYAPNGARECARRRRQREAQQLKASA